MTDIVISEFMDDPAVDALRGSFEVLYDPTLAARPGDLALAGREARALIVRNRTRVSDGLLGQMQALQCVGRLGVGLDNIDLDACRRRSIAVFPAIGANNVSVAEYVITAALILLRGAWLSSSELAAGAWPRNELIGRELAGKVIGLIGFGAIARDVAKRAAALGMSVQAFDLFLAEDDPAWRGTTRVDMARLLETSDVVSLHVPLTDGTRRLIDAAALRSMRCDAILINTARGGVVDEDALAAALRERRIGGAALDVFAEEPLSAESGRKFAALTNVLLTPHIAGVTQESNVRVSRLVADKVAEHLKRVPQ